MPRKTYPIISEIDTTYGKGTCKLCGQAAKAGNGERPTKRITVEFNQFRGDDEVYKAHASCVKTSGSQLLKDLMHAVGMVL